MDPYYIILAVLTLLCLAGMCADVAIIYTIFRFKRIRTTFNIFLANWAIADVCALIFIPIAQAFETYGNSRRKTECIVLDAEVTFHITEILFGIVLSLDWCFAAYYQNISGRFRKYYAFVIGCVWIGTPILYAISLNLCLSRKFFDIILLIFLTFFGISLLFVIALQFSRLAQKCRAVPVNYPKPLKLRLTLITIIIVGYIFTIISGIATMMVILFSRSLQYAILTGIIAAISVFFSSILVFILLCCFDYDFRSHLFQMKNPPHEQFDNWEAAEAVKPPGIETFPQNIITNGRPDLLST